MLTMFFLISKCFSEKENSRLKMENGELKKEVAESKQQIEELQELNSNQQKRRNLNIETLQGLIDSMSNEGRLLTAKVFCLATCKFFTGDSLEVKMEEK